MSLFCLAGSGAFFPGAQQAAAQAAFFRDSDSRFRPEPFRSEAGLRNRRGKAPARQAGKLPEKHKEAPTPAGPHLLVVSVKSQRVSLYANGKHVMDSPVSTGMPTHPTPHGVFSIIQKNRHHRSNIYSGAPMPYMQRLTWSGVALHQGVLPGRPASHGCIRLPEQFASFLWRTTKLGARVIVSREDVSPYEVAHAKLFQPKPVPTTVESAPELRRTLDTTTPPATRVAGSTLILTDASGRPEEDAKPAEAAPTAARETAPPQSTAQIVPSAEPRTGETQQPAAAAAPELSAAATREPAETTSAPQQADIPDAILGSFVQSLQAKQKKAPPAGPVSIFISRKEKKLYVRQAFIPLFSAPVTFRDENASFGTHVLTAVDKGGDSKDLSWLAVTLPPELPKAEKIKTAFKIDARGRRVEMPVKPAKAAELSPTPSLASVLDRIDIPQDVVDRVSEYVSAGASLIISDHGLGGETGLYTDFIIVTR